MYKFHATLAAVILSSGLALPAAHAASSTARGEISITQVQGMLDQAAGNATARQVLTAYLAGVGETAGVLMDMANAKPQASRLSCKRPLTLDEKLVQSALAQPKPLRDPGQTPATPLIIHDMMKRADCDFRP